MINFTVLKIKGCLGQSVVTLVSCHRLVIGNPENEIGVDCKLHTLFRRLGVITVYDQFNQLICIN